MLTILITAFTVTYYDDFFHNKLMANGQKFNQNKLTCASNLYPLNSKLEITYKNKKVIVTVTDKCKACIENIDLSKKAFKQLDKLEKGLLNVKVKQIQ